METETDQGLLLKEITLFLGKNKIPYMITGAWSVIFYARPRASHDIDFVVEMHERDLDKILKIFERLPKEFLVQPEQIKDAILNKGMFNILHLPTALKLDFWMLGNGKFNKSRFLRKKRKSILGQFMYIASPEDTILKKLFWYEESKIEKHLIDAAFVYQIQNKNLDKAYLSKWAKKHKIQKLLGELKSIDLESYY
ncbi:MAG: hypothetical protein HYW63_02005 [Candidatus Levybacteria bacterium]|nr:hypothetical protein [Candidatus Levybacteria bacterium]